MDYAKICKIVLQTKEMITSTTLQTQTKAKHDFVTNVDLQVNAYLKQELCNLHPEVAFFSEEEDSTLSDNCWILDPIDGTTNLVFGYNMSAVSLAHYVGGEVAFGIVFNPFTGEVFSAKKGRGAYLNGDKLLTVSKRTLQDSIIEFGAGSGNKKNAEYNFGIALDVFKSCLDIRRICSSALAICYIAAARMDGYFEILLKPWDYAAAHLILSEAGGKMSDFHGNAMQFANPTTCIASNGANFEDLLAHVKRHSLL